MNLTHRYAVPSLWMRAKLADLDIRLRFGLLNRCEHLQDGNATGPTYMALWADAAVCHGCRKRLKVTGDADETCDRCGRLSRPTIWPHVVEAQPGVLVVFGLCHGCHGSEVAA